MALGYSINELPWRSGTRSPKGQKPLRTAGRRRARIAGWTTAVEIPLGVEATSAAAIELLPAGVTTTYAAPAGTSAPPEVPAPSLTTDSPKLLAGGGERRDRRAAVALERGHAYAGLQPVGTAITEEPASSSATPE